MNLDKYKWKSRILLVITPNFKDKSYHNFCKIGIFFPKPEVGKYAITGTKFSMYLLGNILVAWQRKSYHDSQVLHFIKSR